MAAFELPLDAAKERLVSDNTFKHESELSSRGHTRTAGTLQAVSIISSALRGTRPDRKLGYSRHLLTSIEVVAEGWPLIEHRQDAKRKGWLDIGGILLANTAEVFRYSARVESTRRMDSVVGADGYKTSMPAYASTSQDGLVVCREVTSLDLLAPELDQEVGSVSGRLTFQDLLASMVVQKGIEMPAIEVPTRLAEAE